ncbi:MAG TPA: hypothetical protein VLT36_18860 [Candidatus Dormibacteraeota bacterium]|nr:hypothetical protein [Candidatus Dormibacteraeota bacterium]
MNASETSATDAEVQPDGLFRPPALSEWIFACALVVLLFCINLATYNRYPNVWCDEVWFSEPAVNEVLHGTFTTSTWQFQPANTFPTVNCPLYQLALVPWLKVTGTSLLAVRSFNYLILGISAWLLWFASWRMKIIASPLARLLLLFILHLGYGISFAYRCSRPDMIGLLFLALLFLSFLIRRRPLRFVSQFVLAALLVWIGLQVALFAAFAAGLGWILLRRVTFRELMVLALGMITGLCSVLAFFAQKGVLQYFLPMVFGWLGKNYAHEPHVSAVRKILTLAKYSAGTYFDDFTMLLLSAGLVLFLLAARHRFTANTRKLLVFALILVFGVPPLFYLAGHYMFYYAYARFVPASVAFFAAASELGLFWLSANATQSARLAPQWLRPVSYLLLLGAAALGLPLRLAFTVASAELEPRSKMQATLKAALHKDDIVFCDNGPFFEVKKASDIVYGIYYSSAFLHEHIQGHDFSPEEKNSINVLVIRPELADYTTNYFGSRWEPVGQPFGDLQDLGKLASVPIIGSRLAHYAQQPQTQRYQIQVFRKQAP